MANRAGSGVARIRESRLACFFTFRIGSFENVARDEDFATDFEPGIDDLFFHVDSVDDQATLTHTGDLYTVTWEDWFWGDVSATFEVDGITNLSASDYTLFV